MTNTPCLEFWALEFIWNLGLGIRCLFTLLSFPTHRKLGGIDHHKKFGLLIADVTEFVCDA